MRKCYRCGKLKPVDEFAWRRKRRGQHDSFCRPCRSAYGKEHYAANRQRYIDQARVLRRRLALERTTYLIDYFVAHQCVDGGETDPKCEVVCANCHRRRTTRRRGALRAILTQVQTPDGTG